MPSRTHQFNETSHEWIQENPLLRVQHTPRLPVSVETVFPRTITGEDEEHAPILFHLIKKSLWQEIADSTYSLNHYSAYAYLKCGIPDGGYLPP